MNAATGKTESLVPGCACESADVERLERATLWTLLAINAAMFVVEAAAGWWSESTGLLADSLDMFADAIVYGTALFAVGKSGRRKSWAATGSGIVQIALGIGVIVEVARRFQYGSDPISALMMSIGAAALIANVTCLLLLAKHRQGEIHMRASWIFSTNDVVANLGVIASGALVMFFGNRYPDLLVGGIISAVVIYGGVRILRQVKEAQANPDNA